MLRHGVPFVCVHHSRRSLDDVLDALLFQFVRRVDVGEDERLDAIVDRQLFGQNVLADQLQVSDVVFVGCCQKLLGHLVDAGRLSGVDEVQQLLEDVAVDVRHVHPIGVALAHSGPEHGGEDGTSGRQQNFVSRKLTAANGERDVAVRPAGHVLPQIIGHLQFGSFGQLFAFRFADIFHLTADRQSVVG